MEPLCHSRSSVGHVLTSVNQHGMHVMHVSCLFTDGRVFIRCHSSFVPPFLVFAFFSYVIPVSNSPTAASVCRLDSKKTEALEIWTVLQKRGGKIVFLKYLMTIHRLLN